MSSSTHSICRAFTKTCKPCKRRCKRGSTRTSRPSKIDPYCYSHKLLYKYSRPDDCLICYESLNEVRPLECGHWFHKKCVEKWNDISKKSIALCPVCKSRVGRVTLSSDKVSSTPRRGNVKIDEIMFLGSSSVANDDFDNTSHRFVSNVIAGMFCGKP